MTRLLGKASERVELRNDKNSFNNWKLIFQQQNRLQVFYIYDSLIYLVFFVININLFLFADFTCAVAKRYTDTRRQTGPVAEQVGVI